MLKDVAPFEEVWRATRGAAGRDGAIISFIRFLQEKLGGEFVYDHARIYHESAELAGILDLAEKFRSRGVLKNYGRVVGFPDEPRLSCWYAENATADVRGEGWAFHNDRAALTAALMKMLEKHAWSEMEGPHVQKRVATIAEMRGACALLPEQFSGYSSEERAEALALDTKSGGRYTWARGRSLTDESDVWVPLQVVSANPKNGTAEEPRIRPQSVSGLKARPAREEALLSGALEIIAHDAFMIAWLNQLSLPKIRSEELIQRSGLIKETHETLTRYRLKAHFIRLITDAPAYALMAIVEDETGASPRYTIGLAAHHDPACAAENALREALHARTEARQKRRFIPMGWNPLRKANEVAHHERLLYWSEPGRAEKLDFLVRGKEEPLSEEAWSKDTDAGHLARIAAWCRDKDYTFVSVPLSRISANIPNWHIEFVIIPELQPLTLDERTPAIYGTRLSEIPKHFGYKARKPFTAEPHPFHYV